MAPEYTTTWFADQAAPNWEKWLKPLRGKVNLYLEIGCAEGQSMRWVMENLQPSKAIGIDPYLPQKERQREAFQTYRRRFHENLNPWKDKIRLYDMTSYEFFTTCCDQLDRLPQHEIEDGTVDLCYLDGGHRAWDVIGDAVHVWPKMAKDGVVVFDDLQRTWNLGKPLVWPAFHSFLQCFNSRYRLLYHVARQAAVVKLK